MGDVEWGEARHWVRMMQPAGGAMTLTSSTTQTLALICREGTVQTLYYRDTEIPEEAAAINALISCPGCYVGGVNCVEV